MIIGLTLGLLYFKPKAQAISSSIYKFSEDNSILSFTNIHFSENNLLSPNINGTVHRVSVYDQSDPSKEISYVNNIKFEEQGIVAKVNS